MQQYTVYAYYPSSLGDPVEEAAVERMNALLAEEVEQAGLSNRAKVLVTEDAGRYTLEVPQWDAELKAAVDSAFERFIAEGAANR